MIANAPIGSDGAIRQQMPSSRMSHQTVIGAFAFMFNLQES
jgi:hypothetical protein